MNAKESVSLGTHLIALTPIEPYSFSKEEKSSLVAVADTLRKEDPLLAQLPEFVEAMIAKEMPGEVIEGDSQRLLFDDFSVISHIQRVLGLEFYTSRAFVRAGEGDVVLGTFSPLDGYTEYLSEFLGMGKAHYFYIPPVEGQLPFAVCTATLSREDELSQLIAALSKQDGPLWFHPYMGHRCAWELASVLNERLKRKVIVAAPPPQLCDQVNNKVWFAHAVSLALGEAFIAPVVPAINAAEAATELKKLAKDWPRVSIKLADSASGMGTTIFTQEELLTPTYEALTSTIVEWMTGKDWVEGSSPDVAIEPWFDQVLGSPSVQLWIPPLSTGTPIVEGMYDQLFYADDPFVFLGSIPSQLPEHLVKELCTTGAKIGRVFQLLGYVGRCSFDAILVGESLEHAQLKYVECNGRWGGTSTPMTLLNRVFGDYRKHAYVAQDFDDERLKGMSVREFVKIFGDILYQKETGEGWAFIYNVGCLKPTGKLDIITIGKTFDEAHERQSTFQAIINERL